MRAWVWAGLLGAVVAVGGCDRDPAPARNSMEIAPNLAPAPTGGTPGPVPIPYPNVGMTDPAAKTGVFGGKGKVATVTVGDGGVLPLPLPGLTGNDGG